MNQLPPPAEALARYSVAVYTQLGKIAITDLLALQTMDVGTVPQDRYNKAWSTFELSQAMRSQPKPETGRPYLPSEQTYVRQMAQSELTTLSQDETIPDLTRARALVAAASIDVYHQPGTKNYKQRYLKTIQESARRLLAPEVCDEDTTHYLHVLTALALLSEFSPLRAVTLPALPRQPWDMNTIDRKGGIALALSVAEASQFGESFLPPAILGNGRWFDQYQGKSFATLRAYVDYPAGSYEFTLKGVPRDQLATTAIDCMEYLHETAQESLAVLEDRRAEIEVASQGPAPSAETSWYVSQSSHDLAAIPEQTLRINRANLELRMNNGELPNNEFYTLAWMQLDHAQILAEQSRSKQAEATDLYTQAGRVSRYDARAIEPKAAIAEQEATKLMQQARDLFDTSEATFDRCAEEVAGYFPGNELQTLLDQAAVRTYKALCTTDDFQAITEAAHAYTLAAAALGPKLLQAETAMLRTHDEEQLIRLEVSAIITSLCLLLNGATDETARHLVLPASMRSGSTRGEFNAVILPINLADDRYEREHPVFVKLSTNNGITVEDKSIVVDYRLFMQKGRRAIPFLNKLIQVERMRLARPNYARNRAAEELTMQISDAVETAAEAYAK
ncbi:MAG TPA: hypothetical protein VLE73_03775 [Candidatus Saccharimonadales bacterium]|nr:hypothetical protein [Candidatus Saccharimonadales bacterium]